MTKRNATATAHETNKHMPVGDVTMTTSSWMAELNAIEAKRTLALVQGDVTTLRSMLLRSIMFARFTIQCHTSVAERDYVAWTRTGDVGKYLATGRLATLRSATSWIETLTIEDFETFVSDGWTLAQSIEANVNGIGVAKASFSAALFGATETYCIDVWGSKHAATVLGLITGFARKGDDVANNAVAAIRETWDARKKDRWSAYRNIGDYVFGDRNGQWSFFASADPVFASEGHRVFFASIFED